MRSYTLYPPRNAVPGEPEALEGAAVVRDGFSWPAFLFVVVWFLWHRLWVAALIVLVGLAALVGAGVALHLAPGPAAIVALLFSLLIGLEAASLRRWTYARRGRPAIDVVTARSRTEAEAKLVARWVAGVSAPAAGAPAYGAPFARAGAPVLGLFPEAER